MVAATLQKAGAIGEICGWSFDAEGKLVGIVSTADTLALSQGSGRGARKQEARVSVEHLLGMLRKVAKPRGNTIHPITPA